MLLVTGTKRSGTSMWMQILEAAGIQVLGDAFPRDWEEVIGEANPHGFYESRLRHGIYFATNPNPETGDYLRPDETRELAVKVFIPGVIKSDMAFIDKVVASIRNWREYDPSLRRLYDMESSRRQEKRITTGDAALQPVPTLTPALEWWRENFSLIGDVLTRRYPIHMVAYESVLRDPHRVVTEAIAWLGVGDGERALEAVDPSARTQSDGAADIDGIEPEVAEVFDELYSRIRDREPLETTFIAKLNETHARLQPRIAEELKSIRRQRMERRREVLRRAAERDEQE